MARVMISEEKQQRDGGMDQMEGQDNTKLNLQATVYSALAGIVMLGLVAYLCWTLYKKKYPRRNIPQRDPSVDAFRLLTQWEDRNKPTLNKPTKPDPATDIDLANPASAQSSHQQPRAESTTETVDLKAMNLKVPRESSVGGSSVTSTTSAPSASSAEEDRPSTPAIRKRAAPVIDSDGEEEEAGVDDNLLGD